MKMSNPYKIKELWRLDSIMVDDYNDLILKETAYGYAQLSNMYEVL